MRKNNCTLVTQKKCNEDQTTIKLNSLDHNTEIVSLHLFMQNANNL